jgi:hypothetical protein
LALQSDVNQEAVVELRTYLPQIILGVCITLAGTAIGIGIARGRSSDRFVTVKGLAEREVKADLAIWPITFRVTGNDLGALQRDIDAGRSTVTTFVREAGFPQDAITYSVPRINDTQAFGSNVAARYRYVADVTVTTRSANVDLVKQTMERSGMLVGKGVALTADNWQTPTEFIYTALNTIKPGMIETATKDARAAADKFATDSGSEVGKIRSATQGYFSISNRDANSPDVKLIRVVTSVEFYLVD